MELTWIQKHIMLILIRVPSARLKDLQLPDVPANQFVYHLEGLITRKYIVKLSRGTYALSPTGETLAGTFGTALNKQIENIKTVVMLYGKIKQSYLLFRWSRQPYIGRVTPPHERLGRGVTLQQGLLSALDNKLGSRQPATFKTAALIKISHDDVLISHLNALIFEVKLGEVILPGSMRNGEVFVGAPRAVDGIMNGVEEFFSKVEASHEPFDCEWRY